MASSSSGPSTNRSSPASVAASTLSTETSRSAPSIAAMAERTPDDSSKLKTLLSILRKWVEFSLKRILLMYDCRTPYLMSTLAKVYFLGLQHRAGIFLMALRITANLCLSNTTDSSALRILPRSGSHFLPSFSNQRRTWVCRRDGATPPHLARHSVLDEVSWISRPEYWNYLDRPETFIRLTTAVTPSWTATNDPV